MKIGILNLPWKPKKYDKHVGLVDKDGFTVGTVADKGGEAATLAYARKACWAINTQGPAR